LQATTKEEAQEETIRELTSRLKEVCCGYASLRWVELLAVKEIIRVDQINVKFDLVT